VPHSVWGKITPSFMRWIPPKDRDSVDDEPARRPSSRCSHDDLPLGASQEVRLAGSVSV
jgi:hypothetical protein